MLNTPSNNGAQLAELDLSQPIKELYLELFAHPLGDVAYWAVTEGVVAIVLEESSTLPERLLRQGGRSTTAEAFRKQLNSIFQERLKILFFDCYHRSIGEILSQYQPETGRLSLMLIEK